MNSSALFQPITTFIFDIDGVLTDGTVLVLENGLQARKMNIKDGYALQLAIKKGYRILIVSGATSLPVADRLTKLGIKSIYMSVPEKGFFVTKYIADHNLKTAEVLFMGDDLPDLSAMLSVGLPACPADAAEEIKTVSKYISPYTGGNGCVRDIIEKVLKINKHWHHAEDVVSK